MAVTGCGEGITSEKIVGQNPAAKVISLDIDMQNACICREHGLLPLLGSGEKLPFPDSTFNSFGLIEVIEHLEKPRRTLREIYRVLRPNGLLAVLYPVDVSMFLARILSFKWREAFFDPGICDSLIDGVSNDL